MATRTIPLASGEHDVLVSSASRADWSRGRRISGSGARVRPRGRSQVQGVGVCSQVLRYRCSGPRLFDQPDGVGRQFFVPSVLVSFRSGYTGRIAFPNFNRPPGRVNPSTSV